MHGRVDAVEKSRKFVAICGSIVGELHDSDI